MCALESHMHSYSSTPRPIPPPPADIRAPRRGYIGIMIVGLIILIVGAIIAVSYGYLDKPESDDYDDPEKFRDDEKKYENNVRDITTSGNIIQYVGLLILGIGMIIGAINDDTLPNNVRLGVLIAMGIIIGFKISATYLPIYLF